MLGKYNIKKNSIGSSFQNRFENWTNFSVFFLRKPISNIQKGSQIHFLNISPVFENIEYIVKQYISYIQVNFHNLD